jgi:O-antigen biosynthesis protein WbqP
MKRIFDISVALVLAPLALIVVFFFLPIVWADTGASPIFTQWRVGRHMQQFKIYKLRTMRSDTSDAPSHVIGAHRITRSGRWLRKLKIDELPQIWNVLNGSMSFVGPRPCLPSQSELIDARANLMLFALRPGITGPGQIAGADMSEPQKLAKLDAEYNAPWTLKRDLYILIQTVSRRNVRDPAAQL